MIMPSQRCSSLALALVLVTGPASGVWAALEISRFEPKTGSVGTVVEILGQGLEAANRVLFNGVEATFSINVVSGSISAVVPQTAVTGRILVFTPNGFVASNENFVIGEPGAEIVSLTVQGPVGSQVVLILNRAIPITKLDFNGTEASFRMVSGTLILTQVQPGATSGPITVSFDGGAVASQEPFTVTLFPSTGAPTITGFDPKEGWVGREVLITGSNLTDGVLAVQFGGVAASFANRPDGILATVPLAAQTGEISVITLNGLGISSIPFAILPGPEVLQFDPTSGSADTPVEIFGSQITNAIGVWFGGVSARFELNTLTGTLIAFVPSNAETGPITVTTPDRTLLTSEDFVIVEPLKIAAFTPSGNSGAPVILVLNSIVPVTRIEFNGTGAPFSQMPFESGSLITTWVPEIATSGNIAVFSSNGHTTTAEPFTVTIEASERLPRISKLSPNEAAESAQVLISGANLTDAILSVRFNGVPSTFIQSPGGILATVPDGARSGPVSVITLYGVATSNDSFVLGAPHSFSPSASRISWNREPCLAWDAVEDPTIRGYKLFLSDSERRLFVITDIPNEGMATTCGTFDLRSLLLHNGIYSAYLKAYDFAYQESEPSDRIYFEVQPTVDAISASGGYVEDRIIISGTGFVDITEVRFNGIQASYQVLNPTQIEAEVPSIASSGPVEVVTSGGSIASANDFNVLPSYDLRISTTDLVQSAFAGTELTYASLIQNRGPLDAKNVVWSITLPPEIELDSVSVGGESIVLPSSNLTVSIGAVLSGASVEVAARLKLDNPGLQSLTSIVQSDGPDRNMANNSVTERVEVLSLPSLSIRSVADSQIEVSWFANGGSFRLESTTPERLSPENWEAVASEPRLVEGSTVVTLTIGKSPLLFRLRAIGR